jgi:GAF domain-containing protein
VLPYRGAEGRVEGVVITFVDITRRVTAETALRGSEERHSAGLDAIQCLHALAARLFAGPDLSAGLNDVLESAVEITGAKMGNVQLFNRSKTLEVVAYRGFGPEFLDHFRLVAADPASACGRALRSGKRIAVADVETDPLYQPYRKMATSAGYRSVQSTPLVSRDGRVLGILSTHRVHPHVSSERELQMLDLYAGQAADFVERCRAAD